MTVLSTATRLFARGRFGSVTSKKGNRLFFKGKGGLKPGVHTKFGYKLKDHRMREYVVPDLTDFKLKPYVSIDVPRPKKKQ